MHERANCLSLVGPRFCWWHDSPALVVATATWGFAVLAIAMRWLPFPMAKNAFVVISVFPLVAWAHRRRNSHVAHRRYFIAASLWMVVVFVTVILLAVLARWLS